LLREIDPVRGRADRRLEDKTRRLLDVLGQLAADRVGDIDLAALQGGDPRRLVRDDPEDEALDGRRLAPELLERFEDQLDAGRERNEFVRAGPDRGLLEAGFSQGSRIKIGPTAD